MKTSLTALFFFFLALQTSFSQKLKKSEKQVVARLEAHIGYLADDQLEGRRAGTEGERKAMEYISGQFQQIGLAPMGTEGYFQAFPIYDGKKINPATHLIINGNDLKIEKEFFPLAFSPNKSSEAYPAISLREDGMPWFVDLKDISDENLGNPHFDLVDYIRTTTADMAEKGATAIIFYNTSVKGDKLVFDPKDKNETAPIPVVYVVKQVAEKLFADETASVDLKLKVDIGKKFRTGHNILGYINNNAANTVILGAHFDHLGYGEDGNSMLRTGEKLIHNGADDNASGTAALIELARMLKLSKISNTNFLFIAFSAEELGLNGSKYFTENPTIDLGSVSYMINMDMVGRLNDSTKVLTVGGVGTSPSWGGLLKQDKKSPFIIKVDSSGTGPSDHTSFYRKDIPVLFFFTGLHADYHKPSDDANKINYTGELKIIELINTIVSDASKQNAKLVFSKTRETQTTTSSRFSVTMGVMPDYTYAGTGMRLDGISDGKPAQRAGLLAGDIVIALGPYTISSMETYMQALGNFKKGDKTTVKYKRGNETKEATIEF
ncbi:MAG: M20/M25/M40 family metallo-hydrolase [Terrimonas sp.]|nr:M20/M25/M40 family metallo-hydrolase [Terrimonas sp.]